MIKMALNNTEIKFNKRNGYGTKNTKMALKFVIFTQIKKALKTLK